MARFHKVLVGVFGTVLVLGGLKHLVHRLRDDDFPRIEWEGHGPTGRFCGSVDGVVDVALTVMSEEAVDVKATIMGTAVECNGEVIKFDEASGKVSIPGIDDPDDCLGKVADEFGITADTVEVTYNAQDNSITIDIGFGSVQLNQCSRYWFTTPCMRSHAHHGHRHGHPPRPPHEHNKMYFEDPARPFGGADGEAPDHPPPPPCCHGKAVLVGLGLLVGLVAFKAVRVWKKRRNAKAAAVSPTSMSSEASEELSKALIQEPEKQ